MHNSAHPHSSSGFSGETVKALGEITLPLSLGSYPRRTTKMVMFLAVKAPSTYNVILGRPSLNLFRAVASTYHIKVKFPTPEGIGEEIGDIRVAIECYANTLRRTTEQGRGCGEGKNTTKKGKEKVVYSLENESEKETGSEAKKRKSDEARLEVVEELKIIEVVPGDSSKVTRIGTSLAPEVEVSLTAFLRENVNIFAWEMNDLTGIPPDVMLHRLNPM
ncbi:hypothetical protein DH2020_023331 [Rehmannia glutinosa]|uniref:Uncharacterized protein n=1 Tax=Rehmannia glutinosa TaxID=99300 RepID=A0ABR0W833_REHGL